ncbi:MAG: V-type ATP synthase subunit E family protein [Candidatus Omnitrophota bacterium]
MAQEIKDLITQIQQEGIKTAEENAARIKAEADALAQKIIADAKVQAKKIIEQANAETKKMEDSVQASLKQAGRDLLLSLRKEINLMLDRLVKVGVGQALTAEELAKIIQALIKNAPLSLGSEIIVSLNQQDKGKIEKEFLGKLVQETKKQITLKSSEGVEGGFVISFDNGKSIFDFSSEALAEYLSGSQRPELAKILKS